MPAGSQGSTSVRPAPLLPAARPVGSSVWNETSDSDSAALIGTRALHDGQRPCRPTCWAEAFIRFLHWGQTTVIVAAMTGSSSEGAEGAVPGQERFERGPALRAIALTGRSREARRHNG